MMTPRSTVRLQLHADFTLSDAVAQLSYYSRLGISHLYLSPVTCARTDSTHGYDVIDHSRVDPQLGGGEALVALAQAAHQHNMGLILDIVPNHMAAHPDNPWWHSVLQQGPKSPFAQWFDIHWDSSFPELQGKVLLPVLADMYDVVLERGDIRLVNDASSYAIDVCGLRLPLAEGSLEQHGTVSDTSVLLDIYDPRTRKGRQALHLLLQRQYYRLAWWQCAADQINWRRFFEISDLVGLRVERDEVFDAVHALPLKLFEQGLIDGLRIDHVDGLAEPLSYCSRLYQSLCERVVRRPPGRQAGHPWLIVEKILALDEVLDQRWVVAGTTGYDFMDTVYAVMHDGESEELLTRYWTSIARDSRPPEEWRREARAQMVNRHFCAERDALLDRLVQLAQMSRVSRDSTRQSLGRALDQVLIEFAVYRTYAAPGYWSDGDTRHLAEARDKARHQLWLTRDSAASRALDFVLRWLKGGNTASATSSNPPVDSGGRALQADVLRRFQQLTPPLAAKALEDTVFYRYGRLLSRNEVGSDPALFNMSLATFHHWNQQRLQRHPQAMNATATHDHKRGEDARARLAVLTEVPRGWQDASARCLAALGQDTTIDCGAQSAQCYMLLQTIVGAWPPDLERHDEAGMSLFIERLQQWQLKALREAKQLSSWFSPDETSEQEQLDRIEFLLCDADSVSCRILADFVSAIAPAGALNSLSITVLRCTLPGVPDLYQGTDLWDFSLVDPDNRRDVDVNKREALLSDLSERHGDPVFWPELLSRWQDGAIKQAVLAQSLRLRQQQRDLFMYGSYEPLLVDGPMAAHVIAFLRHVADGCCIVIVSRLGCRAVQHTGQTLALPLIPAELWQETRIVLPDACRQKDWCDTLSGQTYRVDRSMQVGVVLTRLPVAVLLTP